MRKQELEKEEKLRQEKNKNIDKQDMNEYASSHIHSEEKVESTNNSQFTINASQSGIDSSKFSKSKAHSKLFGALNIQKAGEGLDHEENKEDKKEIVETTNKKNSELSLESGKQVSENELLISNSSSIKSNVKKSKIKIVKIEEIKKEDQFSKKLKEVKYNTKYEKPIIQNDNAPVSTKEIKPKEGKVQ